MFDERFEYNSQQLNIYGKMLKRIANANRLTMAVIQYYNFGFGHRSFMSIETSELGII